MVIDVVDMSDIVVSGGVVVHCGDALGGVVDELLREGGRALLEESVSAGGVVDVIGAVGHNFEMPGVG